MNDNDIVARIGFEDTVTGERITVEVPGGVVKCITSGFASPAVALTWLIMSPQTCPHNLGLALRTIAEVEKMVAAELARDTPNPSLN